MTRQGKDDWEISRREYGYDSSPRGISYTDLAAKHGMQRSQLSDRAIAERWYEQRQEFRQQLGVKTVDALTEKWVGIETAQREKTMMLGLKYLDLYEKALEAGEIKVNTRDMLGIAAMIRAYMQDAAASRQPGEEGLIDPDAVDLSPDALRAGLRRLELLEAGLDDDRSEPDAPAEPAAATG